MKLTRRGWGAIGLVALAVAFGLLAGQRSLNAVAAPIVAGLVLGAVQLWRADDPTVEAGDLRPGFPGATRTWNLSLRGSGVVNVRQAWPPGLEGEPLDVIVGLPDHVEAECRLGERGVYRIDSVAVNRRDALGLLADPVEIGPAATAVVYPEVYRVTGGDALSELFVDELLAERQEFDKLREYEPGDPLRHVHWKSSAKYDEFRVMEFAPAQRTETVAIAADASRGCDDDMASAAGTIALLALRGGLDVGLTTPDDHLPIGGGRTHIDNVLGHLARAGWGGVPPEEHEAADVSIKARPSGTHVRIGDRSLTLEELTDGADARPIREVALA